MIKTNTNNVDTISLKLIKMLIVREVPEIEAAKIMMYVKPKIEEWLKDKGYPKNIISKVYDESTDLQLLIQAYKQMKIHVHTWIVKHKPNASYKYIFES